MVIIFTVIYWSMGAFSGKLNKVGCNPGADNKTLNIVFHLMLGFTDLITALFGILTTFIGRSSLKNWINAYANSCTYNEEDPDSFKRTRMKMAERAFLYPLATCITLPFEAMFFILGVLGYFVIHLAYLKAVTIGLSGLLTGLAFAVDPATHHAFAEAYSQIKLIGISRQKSNEDRCKSTVNIPLSNKFL
jgi:uncharacterized membrane protein